MTYPPGLRLWHPPHLARLRPTAAVGRQRIVTADRTTVGYEFLYRVPGHVALPLDRWPTRFQDRATEHVIGFVEQRAPEVSGPHRAFINFSRAYLLSSSGNLGCDPGRVVVEIVESVHADSALVRRLMALREHGFTIALDDFVASDSQLTLLPFVDHVKIDVRDLRRLGPRLVDDARLRGATLVAERVEDAAEMERCTRLGFDLFQGHHLGVVEVVERDLGTLPTAV